MVYFIPDESLWEEIKSSVKSVEKQVKRDPPKRLRVVRHGISKKMDTMLDLHGQTVQQAFDSCVAFITKARHIGCMAVTIITGRGTTGKAMIKNEFENWLEHPKMKAHIRTYQWQNRGGAVKINLQKKKSS